ncbi:MAG: hypothetical protein ACT4OW_01840 [Nitrososphaerota archaeon]
MIDFALLGSTSYLSSKGSKFLSHRNYRFLFIAVSGFMIYFGITFLRDAF